MKSVGVKQLKARLSEYIRLVRTGETVLITDRDEVADGYGPDLRDLIRRMSRAILSGARRGSTANC